MPCAAFVSTAARIRTGTRLHLALFPGIIKFIAIVPCRTRASWSALPPEPSLPSQGLEPCRKNCACCMHVFPSLSPESAPSPTSRTCLFGCGPGVAGGVDVSPARTGEFRWLFSEPCRLCRPQCGCSLQYRRTQLCSADFWPPSRPSPATSASMCPIV